MLFLFHFTPVGLGDMYWHLNTGRWIWEHGALPDSDPFTYTTQVNNPDSGQGTISKNYWQLLTLQDSGWHNYCTLVCMPHWVCGDW